MPRMLAVRSLTVTTGGCVWTGSGSGSGSGVPKRSNCELMFQFFGRQTQSLHRCGLSGRLVRSNQNAVEARISRRRLHPDRHAAQKFIDHRTLLDADDTVVRSRHADVSEIRRAAWENLL